VHFANSSKSYAEFSDSELCTALGVSVPVFDPNESFKAEASITRFSRVWEENNGDYLLLAYLVIASC
jgi:hypothetical protein